MGYIIFFSKLLGTSKLQDINYLGQRPLPLEKKKYVKGLFGVVVPELLKVLIVYAWDSILG